MAPQTAVTTARIRGRGQLTLPAEVREALHVAEGDEVEFARHDDGTAQCAVSGRSRPVRHGSGPRSGRRASGKPTGRSQWVTCHRCTAARRTCSPISTGAPRNAYLPGHAAVRARPEAAHTRVTSAVPACHHRPVRARPGTRRVPGRVAGQRRPGRAGRIRDDPGAGRPRHILLPAAAASRRTASHLAPDRHSRHLPGTLNRQPAMHNNDDAPSPITATGPERRLGMSIDEIGIPRACSA